MSKGWFSIASDTNLSMIIITMGGFYDSTDARNLQIAFTQQLAGLDCPTGYHVTLCDVRELNIQSQERVQQFTSIIDSSNAQCRRLAFVTGKSLVRSQVKRLTKRDGIAFFSDIVTAKDWLVHQRCALMRK